MRSGLVAQVARESSPLPESWLRPSVNMGENMFAKARVIVFSDEPIDYPKATKPDLLLAMNQTACDTYFSDLKPDGLLVVDSGLVDQVPTRRAVGIPFTDLARKETGKELVANMVALGALTHLINAVSPKNVEKTLMAKVPKGTEELNRKAFRAGYKAAKDVNVSALTGKEARAYDDELV